MSIRQGLFYAKMQMISVHCMLTCIYLNTPHEQGVPQGQFLTKLSFSHTKCHAKVKESKLSDYLHLAEGRIVVFILFLKVLGLYERQIATARILTQITMSISDEDNHERYITFFVLFPRSFHIVISYQQ